MRRVSDLVEHLVALTEAYNAVASNAAKRDFIEAQKLSRLNYTRRAYGTTWGYLEVLPEFPANSVPTFMQTLRLDDRRWDRQPRAGANLWDGPVSSGGVLRDLSGMLSGSTRLKLFTIENAEDPQVSSEHGVYRTPTGYLYVSLNWRREGAGSLPSVLRNLKSSGVAEGDSLISGHAYLWDVQRWASTVTA